MATKKESVAVVKVGSKTESSKAGVVSVQPEVKVVPSVKREETKKEIVETVLEPLGPHQAYFESPEGEIITGDANKDQIWSRKTNGGKGGWINKRR